MANSIMVFFNEQSMMDWQTKIEARTKLDKILLNVKNVKPYIVDGEARFVVIYDYILLE